MKAATTKRQRPAGGEILADALYSLPEVRRLTGLGTAALRTARKRGLQVRRIGRLNFVVGRDLIAFADNDSNVVKSGRVVAQSAAPTLSRDGLLLALGGLLLQERASPECFADLAVWAARLNMAQLDAEFRNGRTLLLFNTAGAVYPGLVSAEQKAALGPDAAVLTLDVCGIVRLLNSKLAAVR